LPGIRKWEQKALQPLEGNKLQEKPPKEGRKKKRTLDTRVSTQCKEILHISEVGGRVSEKLGEEK